MLRPGRDVVLLQAINLIRVTDRLPFNLYIARVRRKFITGKYKSSIIVKRPRLREINFISEFIITFLFDIFIFFKYAVNINSDSDTIKRIVFLTISLYHGLIFNFIERILIQVLIIPSYPGIFRHGVIACVSSV